ncbi:MAG: hypothetical protein ACOYN8_18775 [Pseudanabaena sp.]
MSNMHPEIEAEYEKVLEIDRAFFDANPDKNEYVRAITAFELDEARILGFVGKPNAVHVYQHAKGVRSRKAIYVKGFGVRKAKVNKAVGFGGKR